jgi:hypothetical protein
VAFYRAAYLGAKLATRHTGKATEAEGEETDGAGLGNSRANVAAHIVAQLDVIEVALSTDGSQLDSDRIAGGEGGAGKGRRIGGPIASRGRGPGCGDYSRSDDEIGS